jgi:predicted RNA polymerase sigma factor
MNERDEAAIALFEDARQVCLIASEMMDESEAFVTRVLAVQAVGGHELKAEISECFARCRAATAVAIARADQRLAALRG